ncbi:MAG: MBG domain-containing protein [Anaeroplasmataceae bacterium]
MTRINIKKTGAILIFLVILFSFFLFDSKEENIVLTNNEKLNTSQIYDVSIDNHSYFTIINQKNFIDSSFENLKMTFDNDIILVKNRYDENFSTDLHQYTKPSSKGYKFDGYYSNVKFDGPAFISSNFEILENGTFQIPKILYAKWTEDTQYSNHSILAATPGQRVNFDFNSGYDSSNNAQATIFQEENKATQKLTFDKPSLPYFVFKGWNLTNDATGEMIWDETGTPTEKYKTWKNIGTGELTVYAMWQITTNLEFNKGNGSSHSSNENSNVKIISFLNGDWNYNPLAQASFIGFERDGYRLKYYTQSEKDTNNHNDIILTNHGIAYEGKKIRFTDYNQISELLFLYAHWEVTASTVNFNINPDVVVKQGNKTYSDTYDGGVQSSVIYEQYYDQEMQKVTIPTLPGFIFTGWFSQASGGVQYINRNGNPVSGVTWKFTQEQVNQGVIILYAQWQADFMEVGVNVTGDGKYLSGQAVRVIHKDSYDGSNGNFDSTFVYQAAQKGQNGLYYASVIRGTYFVEINGRIFESSNDLIRVISHDMIENPQTDYQFVALTVTMISNGEPSMRIRYMDFDLSFSVNRNTIVWIFRNSKLHIQEIEDSYDHDNSALSTYSDSVDTDYDADSFVSGYETSPLSTGREVIANYSTEITFVEIALPTIQGNTKPSDYDFSIRTSLVQLNLKYGPKWRDINGIILGENDLFKFGQLYSVDISLSPTYANTFAQSTSLIEVLIKIGNEEYKLSGSSLMFETVSEGEKQVLTFRITLERILPEANSWVVAPSILDSEYNAQGKSKDDFTFQAKAGNEHVIIEFSPSAGNSSEWTTVVPKDVRTWYARFYIVGTDEYSGIDYTEVIFSITKKILYFEESDAGVFDYNGKYQESILKMIYDELNVPIISFNNVSYLNVGVYEVAISLIYPENYCFNSFSNNNRVMVTKFVINKIDLTFDVEDMTIEYGTTLTNTDFKYKYSGLVNSDTLDSQITNFTSMTFVTNYDHTKLSARKVGTYYLRINEDLNCENYNITYNRATITVIPAKLYISPVNIKISYGDDYLEIVNVQNLKFQDSLENLFDASTKIILGYNPNVGVHNLVVNPDLEHHNYVIVRSTAKMTVTKLTIEVMADDKYIKYGDNQPDFTFSYSNLIGADKFEDLVDLNNQSIFESIKLSTTYDISSAEFRNVGKHFIYIDGLRSSRNYDIIYTIGMLVVEEVRLDVTISNKTISYGDPVDTPYTSSFSGFKFNDNIDSLTGKIEYLCSYNFNGSLVDRQVGTYSINIRGISSSNYAINIIVGELTVIPRNLIINVYTNPIQYGNIGISVNFKIINSVFGEEFDLKESIRYTFEYFGTAENKIPVGTYPITITSYVGNAHLNYDITINSADVVILKREARISVNSLDIIYGSSAPNFSFNLINVLSEDLFYFNSLLTCYSDYNYLVPNLRKVGTYLIYINEDVFLEQTEIFNTYNIVFLNGELNVKAKDLNVLTKDFSAEYGYHYNVNDFETTVTGFEFDDELFLDIRYSYTTNYNINNLATRKVGSYSISTTISNALSNYKIPRQSLSSLTILPVELTVSIHDIYLSYGQPLPEFVFDIDGAYIDDIYHIKESVIVSTLYNPNVAHLRAIGEYALTIIVQNSNYKITLNHGTLHVSKTDLIIKSHDISVSFGTLEKDIKFSSTLTGFKFDETQENMGIRVKYDAIDYDPTNNSKLKYNIFISTEAKLTNYNIIYKFSYLHINNIVVRFEQSGGTLVNGDDQISISINSAIDLELVPEYHRYGYTFGGWYLNSFFTDEYDFEKLVTSNMTLYGKWIKSSTSILGRVTDGVDGIAFANINFYDGVSIENFTSDKDGYFEIPAVELGYYNLTITTNKDSNVGKLFDFNIINYNTIYEFIVKSNEILTDLEVYNEKYRVVVSNIVNTSSYNENNIVKLKIKQNDLTFDTELSNIIARDKFQEIITFEIDLNNSASTNNRNQSGFINFTLVMTDEEFKNKENHVIYRESEKGFDKITERRNQYGEFIVIDEKNTSITVNLSLSGTYTFAYDTSRTISTIPWIPILVVSTTVIAIFAFGVYIRKRS